MQLACPNGASPDYSYRQSIHVQIDQVWFNQLVVCSLMKQEYPVSSLMFDAALSL